MSELSPPAKKKRPPPQAVTVEAVRQITPHVRCVTFRGEGLASFAAAKPAAHMKLFFPEGSWPPPEGSESAPRPPSRTYTPRRYDAVTNRLDVEFVMHGAGLASDWAERARAGDTMWISGGPGGGYAIPADASHLVIVADDTALPAVGMILEALPAACAVTAICEIENAGEERPLSAERACAPHWLHRNPSGKRPGALLESAIAELPSPAAEAHWWVACEAGTMRRIRDLLTSRGVERSHLHTRGYWKFGDTNYPDHDYGAD